MNTPPGTGTGVMEFIGVTTSQSSIRGLFPRWATELGLGDAKLIGRDLPLQAEPARYRDAVRAIAADPAVRGALVTTHKLDLFAAAGDLFDELSYYSRLFREVSCISKREDRLLGDAKDPVTAGRALRDMLGAGYFGATGGHVLCLGAGGAGLALVVHLLERCEPADRPRRVAVTDVRQDRLAELAHVHDELGRRDVVLDRMPADEANALLADLPPHSLVINATGLGKDRPGSPLGDAARFPAHAVAWDLNYRGDLGFLRHARRQREQRKLRVEDGWTYFLHGWREHVAEVFDLDISPDRFERLRAIADTWRRDG